MNNGIWFRNLCGVGRLFLQRGQLLGAIALILLVTACKTELYSDLTERDANDMLALLLRYGISAEKVAGKDSTVSLSVDENRIADAIELLRTHGYPREDFATVGTVFQKQGLVSSPTEDHIRLVYALTQELNETLSQIDGVLSARVHVVMPTPNASGVRTSASSAAVFIRYQQDYDIAQLVSQIKTLVANSIEDLSYDKVSVALFPVAVAIPKAPDPLPEYVEVLNFEVAPASQDRLLLTLGALGALSVLLLAGNVATFMLMRRRNTLPEPRQAT